MIRTSDFLFERGLRIEEMEDYRKYLLTSTGTVDKFNLDYRTIVLGDYTQEPTKVYGNLFIDIFACGGCRYVIFEKDNKGFYKLNVKTFVVKPDTFTHHDYEKVFIGSSDSARLKVIHRVGNYESKSYLNFGEDGEYKAYIVDENCAIPDTYELRHSFEGGYVDLFDDEGYNVYIKGETVQIYRRGNFGCIIKIIGFKEMFNTQKGNMSICLKGVGKCYF